MVFVVEMMNYIQARLVMECRGIRLTTRQVIKNLEDFGRSYDYNHINKQMNALYRDGYVVKFGREGKKRGKEVYYMSTQVGIDKAMAFLRDYTENLKKQHDEARMMMMDEKSVPISSFFKV